MSSFDLDGPSYLLVRESAGVLSSTSRSSILMSELAAGQDTNSDPSIQFRQRLSNGPPRQLHLPQRVSARESLELQNRMLNSSKPAHPARSRGQSTFLKKKSSSLSISSIRREPTGSSVGTPNTGFLSPTFSVHRTSTASLTSIESPAISHSPASRHKLSLSDGARTSSTSLVSDADPQDATIELGGLAKRRGFRGSPLLLSKTTLGDSLRSLSPSTNSPRGPRSVSLSSPRSSMEALTNIIKNGIGASQEKEAEVPPETQAAFDAADPFALGRQSFYNPGLEPGFLPKATVLDFEVYEQAALAQEPNVKKKNRLSNLHGAVASITQKALTTTTTIYDLTIADIPLRSTSSNLCVPDPCTPSSSGLPPPRSPAILVTSPSAHSTSARTDNSACSTDMNGLPSPREASVHIHFPGDSEESTSHQVTCAQDSVPCLPPTPRFNEDDDLLSNVLGAKSSSRGPLSALRNVGNTPATIQSTAGKIVSGGNEATVLKQRSVESPGSVPSVLAITSAESKENAAIPPLKLPPPAIASNHSITIPESIQKVHLLAEQRSSKKGSSYRRPLARLANQGEEALLKNTTGPLTPSTTTNMSKGDLMTGLDDISHIVDSRI